MAQEYVILHEPIIEAEELHEALTRCKSCDHIVPKTMLCLYCGAPILYRHPQQE
ncbi:hypothetical protein MUP51_01750 [Candidatus Bathyarchaeota archaeon]|nr:hypothetical protein [Candidatus Bathyarchaeota archaeon]